MSSRIPTVIEHFDELFNDTFIEKATEEEMELCFDRWKKICEQDNLKTNEVIAELEFYCNSYIAKLISA